MHGLLALAVRPHRQRLGSLLTHHDSGGCGLVDHGVDGGPPVVLQRVEANRIVTRAQQGDNGRIVQESLVQPGSLDAVDRVLGGQRPQASIALQPGADSGKPVQIALDAQGRQGGSELQSVIPAQEVGTGVGGSIQMQGLRPVNGLQTRDGRQGPGLTHQVGEQILQPGDPLPMGACLDHVAHAASDGAHRRLPVEPVEDVARAEPSEGSLNARQQVGGEEGDGHSIPILQVQTHLRRQQGTQLLQAIAAIGPQPGGQPAQVAGIVTTNYSTLQGSNRPRTLIWIKAQPTTVGQGHLLLPAQQEGRLHVLQIHPALLADENPAMVVGQSDLGKVTAISEDSQREAPPRGIGPLNPAQGQPLGHALQAGKKPALDSNT